MLYEVITRLQRPATLTTEARGEVGADGAHQRRRRQTAVHRQVGTEPPTRRPQAELLSRAKPSAPAGPDGTVVQHGLTVAAGQRQPAIAQEAKPRRRQQDLQRRTACGIADQLV